jgi:hypothetical protein
MWLVQSMQFGQCSSVQFSSVWPLTVGGVAHAVDEVGVRGGGVRVLEGRARVEHGAHVLAGRHDAEGALRLYMCVQPTGRGGEKDQQGQPGQRERGTEKTQAKTRHDTTRK